MTSKTAQLISVLALIAACATPCTAGVWSKVIRETVEAVGKGTGKAAREGAEATTRTGGALVVRTSDDLARPIIARFGDDGARALGSLSTEGAERLGAMADDLAAGGRGQDWMRLIAERGDEVTDWLWLRRKSVAVGTVATAILLQPEEFLQASERVATTTITSVAGPIAERAAAAVPWAQIWTAAFLIGFIWFARRRGLRRMFQDLVNGPWRSM